MSKAATVNKERPISVLSQLGFVWLVFFITVVAIYFSYTLLKEFFPQNFTLGGAAVGQEVTVTETPTATPNPTPEAKKYGTPVRLWIPRIKLDANIQQLGLTAEGQLEAPNNMTDVGWYKDGPRPGDTGSAVIDGHKGVNETGVFENLYQLEPGDVVLVYDQDGATIVFRVLESKIYNRNEQPEEIFKGIKGSQLNLITCDGNYERDRGGTPNRLVVFTEAVE